MRTPPTNALTRLASAFRRPSLGNPSKRRRRVAITVAPLLAFVSLVTVVATRSSGAATRTPVTLFGSQTPADYTVAPSTDPTELGVRVQSSVPGVMYAMRYYRGAGAKSATSGHVWDASGKLLATATFSAGTSVGWQWARLSSPVGMAANTSYVVSYYMPSGGFGFARDYFASSPVVSGPLTAPAGANGVYCVSSSPCHPTTTLASTNYWVDLLFVPLFAGTNVSTTTTTAAPTTTTTTAAPTTTRATTTTTQATTTTTRATTTTTTTVAPPPPTGVNRNRPFSASSPWNTPTPAGTKWYDTPSLHKLSDGSFRHWWVNTDSVGVWWSSPTDPVWTFNMPAYVAPSYHRDRPAATFTMRAPANMVAGTDVDHILVVVDPVSGNYVEVWQASVNSATRTVTNIAGTPGWATGNAITGPGAGTMANNDGVRAANFSWAGGLITGADIAANRIDHALVVALGSDVLKGGGTSGSGAWRAPATAWDAGYWSGPIQMGSRLGIPAGTPMPSGLSPLGVAMFKALQTYGAFVGDFAGGSWPNFYADGHTVGSNDACSLFCYWNYNGSSDMEKLAPLLRVADYQP